MQVYITIGRGPPIDLVSSTAFLFANQKCRLWIKRIIIAA